MSLSSDLVSQFAKIVQPEKKEQTETTVYGTVVVYEGATYVKLDGSDLMTPIETTTDVKSGERVTVMVKNHTAIVTGNLSSPAARTGDVKELGNKISEFEIVIADKVSVEQLEAEIARIDTLVAENVTIKERLTATEASIGSLEADNVVIHEKLTAHDASIENLEAKKIDAEVVEATYATIENLEATNATVNNLEATYGEFKDLATDKFTAIEADIDSLEVNKLSAEQADLKYANIEFTNIGKAAIENFYAKSGIIKDLVVGDTTVTGKLVGITIVGDLIEGGTIKADKLVVLGSDGLYYKLNTDGVSVSAEQTEYNSLNGSIITAKTITAEKINVHDLVAFDATIGGFHISDDSIYSGVKSSADNTTRGIFLGKAGELNVGDETNYLKYYRELIESTIHEVSKQTFTYKGEWDSTMRYSINDTVLFSNAYYVALEDILPDAIADIGKADESVVARTSSFSPEVDERWTLLTGEVYDGDIYTKEQTILDTAPTGGIDLGVNTTTGEPVYSYTESGIAKYYCIVNIYKYKLAISAESMIFSATGKTVDDTIGDVQTSFSKQTADIISACNDAISEALKGYVENGDYTQFRETVNAQLAILSDRITMNFNTTVEEIDSLTGDVENRFTTLSKYINFSQDGIEIGSGESTLKLTIDNDRICFEQDGKVKGWWDGSDFHTGNIMVEVSERAQFGNFAFIPRSDGSLMFLKVNNSTDEGVSG